MVTALQDVAGLRQDSVTRQIINYKKKILSILRVTRVPGIKDL